MVLKIVFWSLTIIEKKYWCPGGGGGGRNVGSQKASEQLVWLFIYTRHLFSTWAISSFFWLYRYETDDQPRTDPINLSTL